jgi:hypothetical protein
MLVIHWSKHNNTNDILKNGIRPKTRKREDSTDIKGVWCYPYTRNKTLNGNWKRNLKIWRGDDGNFNGFVFKLEDDDFPIFAGSFAGIGTFPEKSIFDSYELFSRTYGKYFHPNEIDNKNSASDDYADYQDFELILNKRIDPSRIIKVIKDRTPSNSKK